MPISEVTCEDNMVMMARYPDKFFDLAIVDPPYGIDINMNMGKKKGQRQRHDKKSWDKSIPSSDYFQEVTRVSKNQIIWGGNYFTEYLSPTKSWVFWDKLVPKDVSFADGELAWTSFDKTLIKITVPYSGFMGSEGKIHPTQKPVKLYIKLLQSFASPGDKILDTHLGSGSSRIAAYDMGFDFWGCELDPDYFKAQNERFRGATLQATMF